MHKTYIFSFFKLLSMLTQEAVYDTVWSYSRNDRYLCWLVHYLRLSLPSFGTHPKRKYIAHNKVKKRTYVLIKRRSRAILYRGRMLIGSSASTIHRWRKWSHIIQSLRRVCWHYRISSQSYNEAINYSTRHAIWVRQSGPQSINSLYCESSILYDAM
jgi:hypothetical protein